jgi:hypothetical protein
VSRTSRGKWLRCPACAELPHWPERCLGRDAGCCCRFCPGRWEAILADALKTVMQHLLLIFAERPSVRRLVKAAADHRLSPDQQRACVKFAETTSGCARLAETASGQLRRARGGAAGRRAVRCRDVA